MRYVAIPAIRFYQRHLSPRKGFCCAYRHHLGRFSCSVLGLRAIRMYGLFTGLAVLRKRLALCGVTHRRYGPTKTGQRGSAPCDVPCDCDALPGCDLPNVNCGRAADFADCCDCSCDGPDRRRRRKGRDEEKYVHIPPARSRVQRQ